MLLQSLLADLKTFSTFIFIAVLLIILDNLGIFNLPKSGIQWVTSPIQYGLYKTSLGISNQFSFIFLARRAFQEDKALREQLGQVLSENANLRRKLGEAEGFLTQQNALSPQTFTLSPARPIGFSRYLIIDKGSDDNLKAGQTVIFKDNYIGRIKNISPKKSQVELSSDPDSKISAFVADNAGKAKGVLLGQFGSDQILDKILHQESVAKNDLVYTDGTEENIPKGLILGQVTEVMDKDNEVFKQAKVRPFFEVNNLDVVFVITN